MIDKILNELKETWGYTIEELDDIKVKLASYALYAAMDSSIRKEAEEVCQNYEESR